MPLKQRDRWNIIAALIAGGDASGHGVARGGEQAGYVRRWAQVCVCFRRGIRASGEQEEILRGVSGRLGVKEDWITASLPQFNYWSQAELTSPYVKPALEALPQLKRERKIFFVVNWLDSFIGNQHSAAALSVVDHFLRENHADPDLRLKILEVRDELERTVRIRTRFGA